MGNQTLQLLKKFLSHHPGLCVVKAVHHPMPHGYDGGEFPLVLKHLQHQAEHGWAVALRYGPRVDPPGDQAVEGEICPRQAHTANPAFKPQNWLLTDSIH
ncbi:MAG: hypothetical protein JWM59_3068 [Verrucomicrobiales bacterium]|nr:hypothetical protein [Verrucomicrobiales bacterium]